MTINATFTTVNSFDLDHYRAQPGNWNVQAEQLSRGSFRSQIRSLQYEDLIVYDNKWGAESLIRGQSPAGWIMFGGIITPEHAQVAWCGQVANDQMYACTSEGQAIEFNLSRDAHDIVVLIKPTLLAQVGGDSALERIIRPGLIDFRHRGPQLIRAVLQLLRRLEEAPDAITHTVMAADIRADILGLLELCFNPAAPRDDWTLPRNRREEAIHSALNLVWHSGGQTNAAEMAKKAGVSQRTLEIAFSSTLDLTPGKYLKIHRMNQSRQKLTLASAESSSVTEIALSLGFSHAGRFSSDYRKLFGELPSQTLYR